MADDRVHSPEPWEQNPILPYMVRNHLDADTMQEIAVCKSNANGCNFRNAGRIVACINACKGISTEDLENEGVVSKQLLLDSGMSRADILALHPDIQGIMDRAKAAQEKQETP